MKTKTKTKTKTKISTLKDKVAAMITANMDKGEIEQAVRETMDAGYVDDIITELVRDVMYSKEMKAHFRSLVHKNLMKRSPQLVKDFTSGVGLFI